MKNKKNKIPRNKIVLDSLTGKNNLNKGGVHQSDSDYVRKKSKNVIDVEYEEYLEEEEIEEEDD